MKLHYTPKSHFARKVRLLLDALLLDVELIDAGNVVGIDSGLYAGNPMMKVPTLIDGETVVFESDHIAQYLINHYDSEDRFNVLADDWQSLNARAVMNGVMMAEVELVMADRTGIDTSVHSRYDKFRATVKNGLAWLENHADLFVGEPSYADFHLISLWDHLVLYKMFELDYPKIQLRVEQLTELDYVAKSKPFD